MIRMWIAALLCVLPLSQADEVADIFGYGDSKSNLVKNWDFEETISNDDWVNSEARIQEDQDAYTGRTSLRISGRTDKEGGVSQMVYGLKPDTNYYFSVFMKLLNNPKTRMYTNVRLCATIYNGSSKSTLTLGKLPDWNAEKNWDQLGGDFRTPKTAFDSVKFFLYMEPIEVNYLLDTASLKELPSDPNWSANLDEDISRHRMNKVNFVLELSKNHDWTGATVDITLKKHAFEFGMAIKSYIFNGKGKENRAYRNLIFDHFNAVVFENDHKWRNMERDQGKIKYNEPDKAMKDLLANNISIRGHALLWDNKKNNPDWVQPLKDSALSKEVKSRIDYLIDHYRGQVLEWDVNNEYLHNRYYEESASNQNFLEVMFQRAHAGDPGARLCLNDYELLRTGSLTSAQASLARALTNHGVPVGCSGLQSHLRVLPMAPEVLKQRLAVSTTGGVPVVITELSLHNDDVAVRAEGLNIAMRTYYANPHVSGIYFWGHSDLPGYSFIDDMVLTTGKDMTPNLAGQTLFDLMNGEWNTTVSLVATGRTVKHNFKAHLGQYEVVVKQNGEIRGKTSFTVNSGEKGVTVKKNLS